MDMEILDLIYESSTNNQIYGMGDTTIEEIKDYTLYKIEDIMNKRDLKINILELSICGSRTNQNPHKDADLDIIVYYTGNISPSKLSYIFHQEQYRDLLTYDKVYIDLKPIKEK